MADFEFFYNSRAERGTIKGQQNALGRRTKHDDFVNNTGQPTDGNSGRLTFTDDADVVIPKVSITRADLRTQMEDEYAESHNLEITGNGGSP